MDGIKIKFFDDSIKKIKRSQVNTLTLNLTTQGTRKRTTN